MTQELKKKALLTLGIIFIIQILSNIPVFGVNSEFISAFLNSQTGSVLNNFSFLSGNALQNMTFTVIGISPFITVSIILQLLRTVFPTLDEKFNDGRVGKKLYKKVSIILGIFFAIVQSIPTSLMLARNNVLIENSAKYIALVSICFIAGSIVLILLSNIIDEKGIGNGISLILLFNIVSRIPLDTASVIELYGKNKVISSILAFVVLFLIINLFLIWTIYLQEGESRIPTNCASGNMAVRKSYIPLKVNIAGVMPIIFIMNLFQFYSLIVAILNVDQNSVIYKITFLLSPAYWFKKENLVYTLGIVIYVALLYFFQYFYSGIAFDTYKISDNLKKSNQVIPGIRPGAPTKEYLDKRLKNINGVGFIGILVIALIPTLVASAFGINSFSFTGTSIIIVVGVILETAKTINTQTAYKSAKSIF